ncbi:MAG: hypothetical protein P9M06_05030 [Candidatus Saelkia tenebricola]|nr:hypothetical protein [Candidatus Saelkia tenebricola]
MNGKKLAILIIVCLCVKSVDFAYARRIKEDIPAFNYQTLVIAIAQGKRLVEEDNHPLNDIRSNFRGRFALYYLAQALEEAIKDRLINWDGAVGNFETSRLNKLSNQYIESLGAVKVAISQGRFFKWKQEIDSNLERYSDNEGQIRFAFDYGIENVARLYDIFGAQYGWNKLHVMLGQISKAIDLFEINAVHYKGENGQKQLAQESHISHPGILYYVRGELGGYQDDEFRWSENVFTSKELDKIKQVMQSLSIESEADIFDLTSGIHRDLFNLVQQHSREEVVEFLKEAGTLGISFISENPGKLTQLFQLVRIDNWQGFVADYIAISEMIEECCKMYGTEARELSDSDQIMYQDVLGILDNQIKHHLHYVNDLVFDYALKFSNIGGIATQAQEDFKLLLDTIFLYKSGELQEKSHFSQSPYFHIFDVKGRNLHGISLTLHEEETVMSEASIRWNITRTYADSISLRLDKDRHTQQIYLDISSTALEEMYQIMNRESGHHFEINVPGLNSRDMFKTLVRIFY